MLGLLIIMRAKPKVTLRPGEGIQVMRCKCKPIPDGTTDAMECAKCASEEHTCSQLCACKRNCLQGWTTPRDGNERLVRASGILNETENGTITGVVGMECGARALPRKDKDDDESDGSCCDDGNEDGPNPNHTVSLTEALGEISTGFPQENVQEYIQSDAICALADDDCR